MRCSFSEGFLTKSGRPRYHFLSEQRGYLGIGGLVMVAAVPRLNRITVLSSTKK